MQMKNYFFLSILLAAAILYSPFRKKEKLHNNSIYVQYAKKQNGNETKLHVNLLNAGNPFITNYDLNLGVNDQIWSIIQDKEGAMLFGSNKGIIVFDGREQVLVKMHKEPLVMAHMGNSKKILVGCDDDYGYLEKDEKGIYTYKSLSSKELHPGAITNIQQTSDAIYFYSQSALIQFSKLNLSYKNSWYSPKKDGFEGIIKNKDQIFIKVKGKGIFKTEESHQKTLIKGSKTINSDAILFNLPYSPKKTLIGTRNNKLYLFDGNEFENYGSDYGGYLSENQLVNGCELSDSLFVLSTISGGALIANKYTGKVKYTINYQTGLPDDEIFAIGKDLSGALWLSHAYGISRVNYNLPVYDFKAYPGLEGRLIDVQKFDSTIYVATTQGLFYLDTLSTLKEKEVFVKKRVRIKNKQQQKKVVQVEPNKKEVEKPNKKEVEKLNKKKSFFERRQERKRKRRLKKQKAKGAVFEKPIVEENVDEKPIIEENPTNIKKKYKTKYIKEKKYYNETLGFAFKKVDGVDNKCKQLLMFKNYLLVASTNGFYIIHNNKAKNFLRNIYVNQITASAKKNVFYLATDVGVKMLIFKNGKWFLNESINPQGFDDNILSVIEENSNTIWMSGYDIIYKLSISKSIQGKIIGVYDLPSEISENIVLREIQNKLFFLASNLVFQYNKKTDNIQRSTQLIPDTLSLSNYIYTQPSISWFKSKNKWMYISDIHQISKEQLVVLNIFDRIKNIKVDFENNLWVIDGKDNLYKILPEPDKKLFSNNFHVFFKEIKDEKGRRFSLSNIEYEYEQKSFNLNVSAPFYFKQDAIKYQYFIKGIMTDWSDWRTRPDFDVFIAKPGKYEVSIRAINVFGNISQLQTVVFKIKAPYWMTTWFYLAIAAVVVLFLILIVVLIVQKRERKLLKEKEVLEAKVMERTFKISKQKEEIEHKNKEITDSINYASNIQRAVMPPTNILDKSVTDYFIINKPRDIVSGDYYWLSRKNGYLIATVADCTGHGVPGAFLSMLGISFLKEITNKMLYLRAADILNQMREKIIDALHQTGAEEERKDGMDMSLSILDLHNMKLQFAGAYNPLFLGRDGNIEVFKGDRMPIGIHTKSDRPFTGHEIEVQEGDTYYMFSDGFIDQFGGEYNRKFLSKNFKKLLQEIQGFNMETQKDLITQTFEMWKGKEFQVDDILIMGIRI